MEPGATTVSELLERITTEILNPLITVLFGVALLAFVWGVIMYVIGSQGDDAKLKLGKKVMLWGIIGLFIMASAWGIVGLFCDFFGENMCE